MADKILHFLVIACQKPLSCLLIIGALLFAVSWFFLLGSSGLPHFLDLSQLPGGKVSSVIKNRDIGLEAQKQESQEQEPGKCDPNKAILNVFIYDMPPEFHFGLLDWKPEGESVWPDIVNRIPFYPGGLKLQHSIEYWLTLDLLSSRLPDRARTCSAVRVMDSRDADVVFVLFFSSLSYNIHAKMKLPEKQGWNKMLLMEKKLVEYLTSREEWKRSGGRDHVIMAHHPNSMVDARIKLWPCMFILSDFGRYPPNIANVEKDVIAPYKHVIKTYVNDSSGFDDRTTLLYFQGAIYRKDISDLLNLSIL